MKNNKIIFYSLLITFIFSSTVFANKELVPKEKKRNATKSELRLEKKDMMKNTIFGKIDVINNDTITLSLATRSEIEKPKNLKDRDNSLSLSSKSQFKKGEKETISNEKKGGDPKENNANKNVKLLEKDDFEKVFVFTGEKKTIDIKTASYGFEKPNEKVELNNTKNENTKEKEEKTISSLKVGDYVIVQLDENNFNVAKNIIDYNDQPRKNLKATDLKK